MKKSIGSGVLVMAAVLLLAGSVFAAPMNRTRPTVQFDVTGWADAGDAVANRSGRSDMSIDYSFGVDASQGVGMSQLILEFDNQFFAEINGVEITKPDNWQVNEIYLPGMTRWEFLNTGRSGTPVGNGDELVFTAQVEIFDELLDSDWSWTQNWIAVGTGSAMCKRCGRSLSLLDYGTVTLAEAAAPAPVPEPATMLLFGIGLVGLVGSRIRRKKK